MHFHLSHCFMLLAFIAFVIGAVLALVSVSKRDCELEQDRSNVTRATLFLLVALVISVLILVAQREQLSHEVHSLME